MNCKLKPCAPAGPLISVSSGQHRGTDVASYPWLLRLWVSDGNKWGWYQLEGRPHGRERWMGRGLGVGWLCHPSEDTSSIYRPYWAVPELSLAQS